MTHWKRIGLIATIACGSVAASPSLARAQAVSFGNQKAWVTTTDGQEQQGRLTAFTPAGVQLRLPDGRVTTLPMNTVQRVDVRDGLGNGARNGAIAGALFSTLGVIEFAAECHDCTGYAPFAVSVVIAYTAVGAGIGVGVDALIHGRQTIYSASAPRQVSVAPIVRPRAAGVNVGIRW